VSGRTTPAGPLDPDATVAVVGGSLAGLRAIQGLRRGGHRGRIVLVGAEPHLPYDRPPLSKQILSGKWDETQARLIDEAAWADLTVDAVLGHRAIGLDSAARRLELDDGSSVSADALIVATGATPRRLFEEAGVLVLRTLEDCVALRSAIDKAGEGCRLVVIGAGFIGSEVAATGHGMGCAVTVLEALGVPLELPLGPVVGAAVGALHGRNGVDLQTGAAVTSVERRSDGTLAVGLGGGTELVADVVVAGIGVAPEVGWLLGSGLEIENGVVCDASLFAADGIVAAGDVARWPLRGELVRIEHWQLATEMGDAAAQALAAGRAAAAAFDPVPYFWSDQYGEKLQVLGRPGLADEVVVVDGSLEERFVALYRRGTLLSGVAALTRPRALMSYRPLLAAGASFDEALAFARGG
jgi:3-phenylpropionate/trans-cinnamate dioxygenase ferredoxin reductase subunit